MLQITLAPAPVALEFVEQAWWRLLIAARHIKGKPNLLTRASHQCRFDKIVAQNFSAKGRTSWQPRQCACFYERFDAKDSIVPPVIALPLLPVVEACAE